MDEQIIQESKPSEPAKPSSTQKLLKIIAVFYAISIIATVVWMFKQTPGKKISMKGVDIGKISSLVPEKSNYVGIVSVYGAIYQTDSQRPWGKGSQQIVKRLKTMAEKKEVKAIVLDINSPGGTVAAIQEIHSTLLKIKSEHKKPLVAMLGDVAASGGYYVASACDMIVSHPGTLTGSIGVIFNMGNVEGLFKKIGVKSETIKSGKFKDIGSITRQMTDEERKLLKDMIDDTYLQFISAVSSGRKIPIEKLNEIADGRIYTGTQAIESKLIDKLGDMQDAIDLAGKLGGIEGKPKVLREAISFDWDNIMSILDSKINIFPKAELNSILYPRLEYRWEGF
jgi:protease-4